MSAAPTSSPGGRAAVRGAIAFFFAAMGGDRITPSAGTGTQPVIVLQARTSSFIVTDKSFHATQRGARHGPSHRKHGPGLRAGLIGGSDLFSSLARHQVGRAVLAPRGLH